MSILELRILPPVAIARLGAASEPLEAFDLEINPEQPLDYRRIVPQLSLEVDANSGEINRSYLPKQIRFKDENCKVRPVAPFLEVFARTSEAPDQLQPLTTHLLAAQGLSLSALTWDIHLSNIKVFRRTRDVNDQIHASILNLKDHQRHPVQGQCNNFLPDRTLPLGYVQFIKPTADFPEIRLRYTPASGMVYGTRTVRQEQPDQVPTPDPVITSEAQVLFDINKTKWLGYYDQGGPTDTNPGSIYAGYDETNTHVSWGYIDDECDGYVRVLLKVSASEEISAQAHLGAGPPAYAPDTLPVRVVSDEMEQILLGKDVQQDEVSLEAATELVLRALETVRVMNTAVMNGNPMYGRIRTGASTMVAQNTNDFERYYEPIAATSLTDNLALRTLHERVFSTLAAGGAPWFAQSLRAPEEIGDLSPQALRKMPALMRGADGRSLTLTRRQIDMVIKASQNAMFAAPPDNGGKS